MTFPANHLGCEGMRGVVSKECNRDGLRTIENVRSISRGWSRWYQAVAVRDEWVDVLTAIFGLLVGKRLDGHSINLEWRRGPNVWTECCSDTHCDVAGLLDFEPIIGCGRGANCEVRIAGRLNW